MGRLSKVNHMVYHHASLDRTFAALAAPARRAILAQLATGEPTIMELAGHFDMTLPAVSKHVRVLERAGLAVIRRDGRARRVRLRAAPLQAAAGLLDRYRVFWTQQLDSLESFLAESVPEQQRERSARSKAHATRRNPRR